jgi:signal transduction histidine kinase
VWRDWVLVALLVPTAIVEWVLRDDVTWRPVVLPLAVGVMVALLWRRTHPLLVVAAVFGTVVAVDVVALFGPAESIGLYAMAAILLLPYSLLRWGSGREILLGLPVILATLALSLALDYTGVVDSIVGSLILLFPATLGVSVRYWASARVRELDQVKLLEREQLARELHDTVAHHVSAIAIRAQAGRVVSASDPDAAVDALVVIEDEASRTLAELRSMVGALREDGGPALRPQPGIADLQRLADVHREGARVEVGRVGNLVDVSPTVEAAIYRIAQESITNSVRHARGLTTIDVRVEGDEDCVRLTVHDDGAPVSSARSSPGYGVVGMSERAALLGGSLEAGPAPAGGWTVRAVLPRRVTAR